MKIKSSLFSKCCHLLTDLGKLFVWNSARQKQLWSNQSQQLPYMSIPQLVYKMDTPFNCWHIALFSIWLQSKTPQLNWTKYCQHYISRTQKWIYLTVFLNKTELKESKSYQGRTGISGLCERNACKTEIAMK